jgi:hypothetical protein
MGCPLPVIVHPAQFAGDAGNVGLAKEASVPGQPARVEVSRANDVFDAMQGDSKPSGNFAHGWHRRDGFGHGSLSY